MADLWASSIPQESRTLCERSALVVGGRRTGDQRGSNFRQRHKRGEEQGAGLAQVLFDVCAMPTQIMYKTNTKQVATMVLVFSSCHKWYAGKLTAVVLRASRGYEYYYGNDAEL